MNDSRDAPVKTSDARSIGKMLPRDTGDFYTYGAGIWPTMGSPGDASHMDSLHSGCVGT